MVTRSVTFAPGEYYHVYNRGTDKRVIFNDPADYQRFLELLFLSNSSVPVNVRNIRRSYKSVFDFDRQETLVDIGAYCLMPNHFHILIKAKDDFGPSTFMNKLGTSYSMYFNKRYERSGVLFEGRFKSRYVNTDEYLKYLYSYIHLNPVKLIQGDWKEKGIENPSSAFNYLKGFQHSSFLDYLGIERLQNAVLDKSAFPDYFSCSSEYQKEILEWLTFNQES